ncbi:MAG: NAD(P)-binding domain-containing protein [Terriglobia bacterium]
MSKENKDIVTVIGAGPYGLAAAAYLRDAGVERRVFGEPMSFWARQMPEGMCLRSNWGASHIADPRRELTLDAFCRETGQQQAKPIPLSQFVAYGQWFQRKAVPDVDQRLVRRVEQNTNGFVVTLADGETFHSRRVVVATGIDSFAARPREFDGLSPELVSHSREHTDLGEFRGRSVVVIGGGQSALESAALLRENGAEVEVLVRQDHLKWVGLHPRLHHLGFVSRMLYSKRDVGPAGISRLVAAPHLFRRLPRGFQDKTAARAIRAAVAGWVAPRMKGMKITLGRHVTQASADGNRLRLTLNDGTERMVDHVLLATGYRVDVTRYSFLAPALLNRVKTVGGFPVLGRGLESSVPGLHFLGKPAAWSFGPIVGFVSGTEFAATELLRVARSSNGSRPAAR